MTIKQKVKVNENILKKIADESHSYANFIKWGKDNGFDNRSAFSRYKKALKSELEIDLSDLREQWASKKKEKLKSNTTITLYSDAKASKNRFAITDQNGNPVWFGIFFDEDGTEQSRAEMLTAKKAVWLARKIADENNLDKINLKLFVDAQWLCYANSFLKNSKAGGKASELGKLALKYRVNLDVVHVSGAKNPADKYTICRGYMRWNEAISNIELKKELK